MAGSIERIKASDGTGPASVATVTNARSSGASTIQVDTILGINDYFYATMGEPHTFTDPVTGETITIISEDTAVDFKGHLDGSNIEIDSIAPGFSDSRGSEVGDIVIIKPTTQYADNIAEVLSTSMNDDGSLKAVTQNPGWTALAYTPNSVTYNGNRSYTCTFNGVNLTTAISPGMRFRTTRTVAAPTQCTSLNGTSQYWVKTSPSAMTFTDDFVVSAWMKLSSYNGLNNAPIVTRYNGTSGWEFRINQSGQVEIVGRNGGSSNFSLAASYQSIPLNKWVHVAAQLDMSAFTATSTTSYIMIDGVDVPVSVSRSGTNPTALVQAGNLEVGGSNSGAFYFPGKIAQVAIYNAKVTQANIRATISQGLTGSETSLISAYSFNNSTNDLSANANNLTANGSAVATNADSPFGGQADGTISSTLDYAIVQAASFSTNTTLTVQVPEGCTIPTSGGVSAVSYSSVKVPYGFPAQRGKWRLLYQCNVIGAQASPVNGTTYNLNSAKLNTPVGAWSMIGAASVGGYRTSSGGYEVFTALSTANNSVSPGDTGKTWTGAESGFSGIVACRASVKSTLEVQQTTQGDIYLVVGLTSSSAADLNTYGNFSPTTITAENAYL